MDPDLIEKILLDITEWINKNNAKYNKYTVRCTHDLHNFNIGECTYTHFAKENCHNIHFDGGPKTSWNQFNIILEDDRLVKFVLFPTKYYEDNIAIKVSDNKLDYYRFTGYVKTFEIYNITELYNYLKTEYGKIPSKGFVIDNYFDNLPNLHIMKYVLDKMNPNYNEQIVIEI